MDPMAQQRLGRTDVTVPACGFGCAPLGNLFEHYQDTEADATITAAYEAGIRYFDTSPWYGRGLSELRLGASLRQQPRADFLVSTKVGRVLTSPADFDAFARKERAWEHGLPFEHHHDYSYDGVMRSYEDSLQRLGLNRVDLLIVHDLDEVNLGSERSVDAHLSQLVTGGHRALTDLKASGRIGAIGVGVNRVGTIPRFLDALEVDFFLVATPYTLAEQPALDHEFPLCAEHGASIIIGAVFASGILATGAVPGARYNYAEPTLEQAERIRRIEGVCASYEVPLPAAALQFPLHHPIVASIIPGAVHPSHVTTNLQHLRQDIPTGLWADLKDQGLLREDAPTPS